VARSRGRPPVNESSRSSRRSPSLNASASQGLMLMRGCLSLSLPSGFVAILSHLLSQVIDANDLPEDLVGFTEHHLHLRCRLPHACLSFTTQTRQPAVHRGLCGENLEPSRSSRHGGGAGERLFGAGDSGRSALAASSKESLNIFPHKCLDPCIGGST
jgi:hypothetical protein